MNRRYLRIRQETVLAAVGFSTTRSASLDPAGRWVIIRDVALPAGYNRPATDILFELPPDYPLTPPDWFFCDPGRRGPKGRLPAHYFERQPGFAATAEGWAGGSLHIKGWRPGATPLQGHSLLTACHLAQGAFRRWIR
ncbi:MAG: hypothetical protein IH608_10180 [Proteobacteria bacterium]|nr:hypothetical protein [Pseudomonadota bacterium]